jgi:hypothetical protein
VTARRKFGPGQRAPAEPQAPAERFLSEIAQDVLFETIHKIRKILFWRLKPSEVSLSQIADVSADMV